MRAIALLFLFLVSAPAVPLPKPAHRVTYEAPPQLMVNILALLAAAREFEVDPDFVFSIAWAESELKEWARSKRDVVITRPDGTKAKVRKIIARGLMQISVQYQDELVRDYLPGMHPRNFDWRNPVHSARLGAAYLAALLKRFHGSREYAAAAYNEGPWWAALSMRAPAVPLKDETRVYLTRVFP